MAELDEGYSWKESGSTTLHAGENQSFTLVYTPENPDKYDTVEIPVTVNVEKGSWNLRTTEKVSGGSFTYYYEAAAVDFSALGLFEYVDGADVSYQLSKNGAVVTETIVPVGVYGLTASIAGTDDYNSAEKTIEFRVELTAMQAFISAVDGLDENAANVSEREKLTIANAYKNLSAEEKNQIVESWGVTVSAIFRRTETEERQRTFTRVLLSLKLSGKLCSRTQRSNKIKSCRWERDSLPIPTDGGFVAKLKTATAVGGAITEVFFL